MFTLTDSSYSFQNEVVEQDDVVALSQDMAECNGKQEYSD
jgi:hypothetical protein